MSERQTTSVTATVKLNVGGQFYEVARTTIDRHPNTMLCNLVSQRWQPDENDEPLFIDRNGHRFQFVLDWMRDGEVNLPVTESYEAFRQELEYFGFTNVEDSSIIAGTLRGGEVMTAVTGNLYEENDAIDAAIVQYQAKIMELENHRTSNAAAHHMFVRCSNVQGDSVSITLSSDSDKKVAYIALKKDAEYFHQRLEGYGLKIQSTPDMLYHYTQVSPYPFVFKRIPVVKRGNAQEKEPEEEEIEDPRPIKRARRYLAAARPR